MKIDSKQFALILSVTSPWLIGPDACSQSTPPSVTQSTQVVTTTSGITPADRIYLSQAADNHLSEVALARLTLKYSRNPRVRQIANHMISDHTNMLSEVRSVAKAKCVALPVSPGATNSLIAQAMMAAKGPNYDKLYMGLQVEQHEFVSKLHERASAEASDAAVKAMATKHLQGIKTHLGMTYAVARAVQSPVMAFRPPVPVM